MKRIIICCDGTWKGEDAVHPTNVLKLARAVLPGDDNGVEQVTIYVPGIGNGRATLSQKARHWLAGATGAGLAGNIRSAYAELSAQYEPGDEIYLFGFSRGAYMARSLGGMIRTCGIVEGAEPTAIAKGFALYRDLHVAPEGPKTRLFRARHAAWTNFSDDELCWRRTRNLDSPRSHRLRIAYIGVWDTVGALGVPKHWLFSGLLNSGHRFHDHDLSDCVLAARHAVSLDEDRRAFEPTLWTNLTDREGLPGLNSRAGCPDHGPEAAYLQMWFPGVHGSVGGGGSLTHHSDDALLWIAEGATRAGLALAPAALITWRAACNPMGPLHVGVAERFGWLARLPRTGPRRARDVSRAAYLRWRAKGESSEGWPYRPAALAHLMRALENYTQKE